jgi:hypothetical protein
MTQATTTHRRSLALATFMATAGLATAAWAATGADTEPAPKPTATVIADLGATRAEVDRAVALTARQSELPVADVVVRRTGGALEATADITELAATHATTITGVGDDARAAVRQVREAELAPGTAWLTAR